ncbi:hypothetical protein [Bifidobacterium sp. SO1]|uniref:hypothetical protein n=1 Tax=Bifidobacterium sp. SO1 TaxID=2809029 RepID=UPI001BDCC125|nr:hypothetical protein [Bifidobacterium sp. SO1]MBT1161777.1 hypothetical protein [Bifidobacterium sp. SO1]
MSVDRLNRSHRAKGLPQGVAGTYETTAKGFTADADLTPPAYARPKRRTRTLEDDARAYDYKDEMERLAAAGDVKDAERMARAAGAFVKGDSLPYLDGVSAAYWDGRTLNTIDFHGYEVDMREGFDPASITIPD